MNKEKEPIFLNVGKHHELCRFPGSGEWSLRVKQGDDVAHLRYLNELEVLMVEAALKATLPEERETIYTAAHLVPTSWLDPLLSGADSVLKGSGPWGCQDIERLLNAIRRRIDEAQDTPSPQREKNHE